MKEYMLENGLMLPQINALTLFDNINAIEAWLHRPDQDDATD